VSVRNIYILFNLFREIFKARQVAAFSSSSLKFSLNARKENRRIRRRRVMKMSGIGEGAE
jgi:hypothetical protein